MWTSCSGQCVVGAGLNPIGIISNVLKSRSKQREGGGGGGMRAKGGVLCEVYDLVISSSYLANHVVIAALAGHQHHTKPFI